MTTGIDISSNNPGYKQLDLTHVDWVCIKATQGASYKNPLAHEQAAWARSLGKMVGFYHWVEPWVDARAQADYFTATIGTLGTWSFWALDCEDGSRPASDAEWGNSVSQIDQRVTASVGPHGLIYVGRFFHPNSLLPLAHGRWWLPDYGPNNGQQHVLAAGVTPVVHQYSSAGGLDHNIVLDESAWQRITGTTPVPVPAPIPTSEPDMFLCQAKGSPAVYTSTGVHVENQTDLAAWQAILIGISGRKEAGQVWPVEQSFIDSLVKH